MRKVMQGREKEVAEIVRLKRAAAVGRLMLGELDGPLPAIDLEDYAHIPRRELREEVKALRDYLKKELLKFCRRNFRDVGPRDLANLYEDIFSHNSDFSLPLQEFVQRIGELQADVLNGAPAHATVHLSPWGLQTEYPEMYLARDLALAYNDALDAHRKESDHGRVRWHRAKGEDFRNHLATTQSRKKYAMRMCLLSCFNLTEAFINGVAWGFVQSHDITVLSNKKQELLTQGKPSLVEKLLKIPVIVRGGDKAPLAKEVDPLATFLDLVKPFRDSIVHASPFSAPERFGGYDKLERVYELDMPTVKQAVGLSLDIVNRIHKFLDRESDTPAWMPVRDDDGRFILS